MLKPDATFWDIVLAEAKSLAQLLRVSVVVRNPKAEILGRVQWDGKAITFTVGEETL